MITKLNSLNKNSKKTNINKGLIKHYLLLGQERGLLVVISQSLNKENNQMTVYLQVQPRIIKKKTSSKVFLNLITTIQMIKIYLEVLIKNRYQEA